MLFLCFIGCATGLLSLSTSKWARKPQNDTVQLGWFPRGWSYWGKHQSVHKYSDWLYHFGFGKLSRRALWLIKPGRTIFLKMGLPDQIGRGACLFGLPTPKMGKAVRVFVIQLMLAITIHEKCKQGAQGESPCSFFLPSLCPNSNASTFSSSLRC